METTLDMITVLYLYSHEYCTDRVHSGFIRIRWNPGRVSVRAMGLRIMGPHLYSYQEGARTGPDNLNVGPAHRPSDLLDDAEGLAIIDAEGAD